MPRRFERTAVLIALVASAFWLPIIPPQVGGSVRSTWTDLIHPVHQGVHWVQQGFERIFSSFLGIFTLEEENRVLRYRLEALRAHEEVHRQLAQENARLRDILDFRSSSSWKTIPAEVIGREMGPWSRSLLIDRGKADGVRTGMAVITPVGLVGRISEAGGSSSRVTLLTDPHFRISAKIGEMQLYGLCIGTGRGESHLTYLPLEATVKDNQHVSTAGGQSFAPKGIPIGTIRRIWTDKSEMYRTAGLTPSEDPGHVEEVLIVRWSPGSD